MSKMFRGNKTKQRDKNVTVWIPRVHHKKLKMMSWKRGVSITYILGEILKEYFEKGGKK